MKRADQVNFAALCLILAAATAGATLGTGGDAASKGARLAAGEHAAEPRATPAHVVDARGSEVPVRSYQRVVSVNSVADHILLRILEPERLVGVSVHTLDGHPEAWRFGARAGVYGAKDLEAILALEPELVVASKFSKPAFVERLREAGVEVFDLGEMRGVSTTRANIDTLGELLAAPEAAAQLQEAWGRQLAALEDVASARPKQPGMYLSMIGDRFYGGTQGSSYADVLRLAGVDDIAANNGYREWPDYSIEQLVAMDPALIVTRADMAKVICSHTVLSSLAACGASGRIVELPKGYGNDSGLGLVEAAAAVQRQLQGEPSSASKGNEP